MRRFALALLVACGRLAIDAPSDPAPSSAPSQPAFLAPPPGTRAASPHAAADASDGADFDAGAACAPDGAVVGGEGCRETDPSPLTHVACCAVRGDVLCCVSPRDASAD